MKKFIRRRAATALATAITSVVPAHAGQLGNPPRGGLGDWRRIGTTHANHTADHDTIRVPGPFDNFRRIKF